MFRFIASGEFGDITPTTKSNGDFAPYFYSFAILSLENSLNLPSCRLNLSLRVLLLF
jgi:hypothetical protein